MKIRYYIIAVFCIFQCIVFSLPVIINDTGNWKGEIQAVESGFFVYNTGLWTQRGANYKDENILSFADDFSPVITNSGLNTVTCTYADIGWIWPTSGRSVSDSISFYTSNLVSKTELVEDETSISYDNYVSIGAIATSPASASYTASYSINVSTTTETTYSASGTGQNTASVTGTLLAIISLGQSISQSLTLAIARTLSVTVGMVYSNSITLTAEPITFDDSKETAHVEVGLEAKQKKYKVSYYNDANHDGLCDESDLTEIEVKKHYDPVPCLRIRPIKKGRSLE